MQFLWLHLSSLGLLYLGAFIIACVAFSNYSSLCSNPRHNKDRINYRPGTNCASNSHISAKLSTNFSLIHTLSSSNVNWLDALIHREIFFPSFSILLSNLIISLAEYAESLDSFFGAVVLDMFLLISSILRSLSCWIW